MEYFLSHKRSDSVTEQTLTGKAKNFQVLIEHKTSFEKKVMMFSLTTTHAKRTRQIKKEISLGNDSYKPEKMRSEFFAAREELFHIFN